MASEIVQHRVSERDGAGHRCYVRKFVVDNLPALGDAWDKDLHAVCVGVSEPVHLGHGKYELSFTYTAEQKAAAMTDTTTETWQCVLFDRMHQLLCEVQGTRFGTRVLCSSRWERRADGMCRVLLQWLPVSECKHPNWLKKAPFRTRLRLWWEMLWWEREVA